MRIRTVLLLVVLVVVVEGCGRNTRSDPVRQCRDRPPRYRHLPASVCTNRRLTRHFSREKRQAKSYQETRTDEQIRAEHNNMINNGYVFIGWHGTSYDVGRRLVQGARYKSTPRTGEDRLWEGAWTSSNVERSVGYLLSDPLLLRVYVMFPAGATRNVFIDPHDINNAVTSQSFYNHNNPTKQQMEAGEGVYVICGPDGAFSGQELILSKDLYPHLRFLYSAHNRDIIGCGNHPTNPRAIEATQVTWDMSNVNAFLASVRNINLFPN